MPALTGLMLMQLKTFSSPMTPKEISGRSMEGQTIRSCCRREKRWENPTQTQPSTHISQTNPGPLGKWLEWSYTYAIDGVVREYPRARSAYTIWRHLWSWQVSQRCDHRPHGRVHIRFIRSSKIKTISRCCVVRHHSRESLSTVLTST